jgi:hypothetical protein
MEEDDNDDDDDALSMTVITKKCQTINNELQRMWKKAVVI